MQPQFKQVYLLHFDEPLGNKNNKRAQAQHYIGYADRLDRRLQEHLNGKGAKITQALVKAGIGFELVRTWTGSRSYERQLKNRKNARALCPVCSGEQARMAREADARLDACI
jgi:predicted GIY-YIG superfamily endonuclease